MPVSLPNTAIERVIAKIPSFDGAFGIPDREAKVKSRDATKPSGVAVHYEVSDYRRTHDTSC